MWILQANDAPWWVAAIVIPLVGLLIWLVKSLVGGLKETMTTCNSQIVDAIHGLKGSVDSGNGALQTYITGAVINQVEVKASHTSLEVGITELLQAQRSGACCQFKESEKDTILRSAKNQLRQSNPPPPSSG